MRGFEDIASKGILSQKGGFLKKFSFAPQGGFDPKKPLFGLKMDFWAYIFETAHQILMIFGQMLDTIALKGVGGVWPLFWAKNFFRLIL